MDLKTRSNLFPQLITLVNFNSHKVDIANLLSKGDEESKLKIEDYFYKLYSFTVRVSKYSKPLMTLGNGSMHSIGGAVISSSIIPFVYDTTTLSFPEASQYGFIPLGGISYYLSRLPNEIGTFLALTGFPLTGNDMLYCKMVEQVLFESETSHNDIITGMQFITSSLPFYEV